ncbi:hypothetical protein AKJ16_DCAP03990 [Drosera capensis]
MVQRSQIPNRHRVIVEVSSDPVEERVACDGGSAKPWMGSLCDPSARAPHHAVQEASQLPATTGESSSAGPNSQVCVEELIPSIWDSGEAPVTAIHELTSTETIHRWMPVFPQLRQPRYLKQMYWFHHPFYRFLDD